MPRTHLPHSICSQLNRDRLKLAVLSLRDFIAREGVTPQKFFRSRAMWPEHVQINFLTKDGRQAAIGYKREWSLER